MDDRTMLIAAVGIIALTAVAVYFLVRPRPMFTSFTRDKDGRVIEIIEKPLRG